MEETIDLLATIVGRDHPHVFPAVFDLVRIKTEMQDFDDADKLLKYWLPLAEKSLGKDHVLVLHSNYLIGRLNVKQERWREARDELIDVSAAQSIALQGWGRHHYRRIRTLMELARVHHELRENDQCDATVNEGFEGFKRIFDSVHPWEPKHRADWETWKKQRRLSPSTVN